MLLHNPNPNLYACINYDNDLTQLKDISSTTWGKGFYIQLLSLSINKKDAHNGPKINF
jgi:hypothetical protein